MNNYFEVLALPKNTIKFNVNHQNPAGQNINIEFLNKAYKLDNVMGNSPVEWVMFVNFYINVSNPNPNTDRNQLIMSGCVASNAVAINRVTSVMVGRYYLVNPDLKIDNFKYTDLENTLLIYSLNEADLSVDEEFSNAFWGFINQQ